LQSRAQAIISAVGMPALEDVMLAQWFPHGIAHYLAGGLLLGAGISLLYILMGRIGGLSTVFASSWSYLSQLPYFRQPRFVDNRNWRLLYAIGVILGGAAYLAYSGGVAFHTSVPAFQLALGGLLAGFGARLANGCTSGHGICGLASLDKASAAAVLTFMVTGIVTANIVVAMGGRP
jgi:uncharacterized protein